VKKIIETKLKKSILCGFLLLLSEYKRDYKENIKTFGK
jgi:hypothetical protein